MSTTRTKTKITGHCSNKQCEGTKPRSASGKPMPTCIHWQWCSCECHALITKIYSDVGLPREPAEQNSDYHPPRGEFWMPGDPDPMAGEPLFNPGDTDTPSDIEGTVATPPSAGNGTLSTGPHGTVEPLFDRTPTGRKARGQLEYEVLAVCQDYSNDVFEWIECTPKMVSIEIGKRNAAEQPSTGAIVEVWKRWERLEFAVWDKNPIRFSHFEVDGSLATLTMIKAKMKRDRKRTRSNLKRGIR